MQNTPLPNPYPTPIRYGAAVGIATCSVVLGTALLRMDIRLESAWMLAAITFAAWFGGLGPGLMSTALCFAGEMLIRYPEGSWRVDGVSEWVGLSAFFINALLISFLFRSHYIVRAWRKVSPVAITDGYLWRYDLTDKSIELSSAALSNKTVTYIYADWLQQIVLKDRERVEAVIDAALSGGQIDVLFHMILPGGITRLVEMRGFRPEGTENGLLAVCLEMGASRPDPRVFLL